VLYQKQVDFERVATLAQRRTYDLVSSFRPSYNMAVNLARNYSEEQAHHLLNSSFGQFLADRTVVSLERERARDAEAIEGYRANMRCHLGDFDEYWSLVTKARRMRERDRKGHEQERADAVRVAVGKLRPGEVISVPNGKRGGLGVVVSSREGKPTVLGQDRRYFRLAPRDFRDPPTVLTRIPLPRSGSARSSRYRRDVAAKLVSLQVRRPKPPKQPADPKVEREAVRLDERAAAHPCHACPERAKHERWAKRVDERGASLAGIERRIRVRTETLARQFDRVLSVLRALGYVEDWSVTEKGRSLSRIYGEGDILVAEALSRGLFEGIEPAEVAALLSSVVYEGRERVPLSGDMPTPETKERYERFLRTWRRVRRTEDEHQVQLCRELEAGFAEPIYHWASGRPLDEVLAETEMAPGDFVRNCKQLVDLLRQVEEVAGPDVAELFGRARSAVTRGVVAYTGV
jgi:ATP-dependent RNA helicase HelY